MSFADQSLREFLAAVAAKKPTPGGGAVASVAAALAASLARMVVNYSAGKASLAAHDAVHQEALRALSAQAERALRLAEEDAQAYARLNELWKLDQNDPRRVKEFPAAVDAAIAAPSNVLDLSLEMLRLLTRLTMTTNPMLKSDLAIAAVLAEAAARSAAWNVRINLLLLGATEQRQPLERSLAGQLTEAQRLGASIETACE